MAHRRRPEPPDWFNLDHYLARPLSEADWYDALKRRHQYFSEVISIPNYEHPDSKLWSRFREDVLPVPIEASPIPKLSAVEEIPNFDPDRIRVVIDIHRPDVQIVAEIIELLATKRPPIRSKGRPEKPKIKLPGQIGKQLIHTWSSYRILPLFDLWFWHITNQKKWVLAPVGDWLYPDLKSGTQDSRVREAGDTLCRALESGVSQLRS